MKITAFRLAAGILLTVQPALAQDHVIKLFATANYVYPLADDDADIDAITDSIEVTDELGWEAGVEWRVNRLIGLEVSYLQAEQDIEFGGDTLGEVETGMWTGAVNFHPIDADREKTDFWFAPIVAFVDWDDIELRAGGSAEVDSEFGIGVAMGFDINIGKTLAITTGLRWLSLDLDSDTSGDFGVDPLIARAGVAFRLGSR
ncbi:MAG: hypothetical protein ACREAA_07700 [Candidatus Polarisedimenticolia bacterium]